MVKRHRSSKNKKSKKKAPSKDDNLKESIDYIENYSHYYRKIIPIVSIIIILFIIVGFSSNKLHTIKTGSLEWPSPEGQNYKNNLIMIIPIVNMFYFVYKYYQIDINLKWYKKIFYGICKFFMAPLYLLKINKFFPAAYIISFIGLVYIISQPKSQDSNILFDINNLLIFIDIVEAIIILCILSATNIIY